MATPPPRSNADLAAITFGIAAMDEILEDVEISYPIESAELQALVGDRKVPYDPQGSTVELGRVIERADPDRFESRRELLNALHPEFEAMRKSGGVGAWLQNLLGF